MRVRYIFIGRVQGVGFRATAQGIAERHPVTGWVRNEPDGTVMLEAQGSDADVSRMLAELRSVMQRNITSMQAIAMPEAAGERGFVVQR